MKILPTITAAVILTASALAYGEPPLPSWTGKEHEAKSSIPEALLADEPAIPDAEPLALEPPLPGEITEDPAPMVEVAGKFLPAYFAERPKNFLVDPQNLLSPADYRDRLAFLNYHASDSTIDLFVYIFGGDQEIPGNVRQEELIERFFDAGRPAAVVYYYMGSPQRSVVRLSPAIAGPVSAAEQRRALESSVMQAFEKSKPSEQIERFLVQMSIRIYWMERIIAGEPLPSGGPVSQPEVNTTGKSAKFLWLRALAIKYTVPAAVLLGVLLAAIGIQQWLRLRGRYRFPEFEVEPRLGGAHAAGIGAVISFASAALPPASQRDQVPDYLWRA